MTKHLVGIIAAVIMIASHCLGFVPISNIGHQIHSNNDLRELVSTLLKGSRKFKFDTHYLPQVACNAISSSPSDSTDPKGCLLLNHDTPVPGGKYNSSSDLVAFFSSESFARLKIDDKMWVSLCFKSAPDFCDTNSRVFANWLSLVDELYASIREKQANSTDPWYNIEVILDGDGKPKSCLVGRWPVWNSVWINTDSSTQEAFYSNSVEHDYYRYQVLNDPESPSNWTWMAQNNYGKFSKSNYSYTLWEPDSQHDYNTYIDIYASGPQHEPAGFNFAINVDSSMFCLYTANRTGAAVNEPLISSEKTTSAISAVHQDSGSTLVIFKNEAKQMWQYKTVDLVVTNNAFISLAPLNTERTLPRVSSLNESDAFVFASLNSAALFGLSSPIVTLSRYGVVEIHETETIITSGATEIVITDKNPGVSTQFLAGESAGKFWDAIIVPTSIADKLKDSEPSIVEFLLLHPPCNNTQELRLSLGRLTAASTNGDISATIVCSTTLDQFSNAAVTSASLVMYSSTVAGNDSASLELLLFAAVDDVIVSSLLSVSIQMDSIAVTAPSWVPLTVGRNVDVVLQDNIIAMVNDYGYCYNSHVHNTRSIPTVCSAQPNPTRNVLDYSIGFLSIWLQSISLSDCKLTSSSMAASCFSVSPCADNGILHGTFDQGNNPQVQLVTGKGALYLLEIHDGFPTEEQYDATKNGCGEPLHRDGLVVDVANIQPWIDNLKRAH